MIKARVLELIDEFADGKPTRFAKYAGIPASTFSGYLSGRTPHVDHLIRIRETFGVSVDWILTGEGKKYLLDDGIEEKEGNINFLSDVQDWLGEMVEEEPDTWAWFRVQFKQCFPGYDEWLKKRETKSKTDNRRIA